MLRLLIVTGLLLMTVGFGAAGWQYWQSLPKAAPVQTVAAAPPETGQSWLISPTGGMVPREEVRAYLAQDRFVPGRTVEIVQVAPLTDLLVDGETLPEAPYLQVLADIRAPKLAEGLCLVLASRVAQDCAVNSARVVAGSVDPLRGTAEFRIELVYRLQRDMDVLPDLAAHVLQTEWVTSDPAGAQAVEDILAATVETARAACADKAEAQTCRILKIALDWAPGGKTTAQARIGWLSPLPEGMFPAPPLEPVPGG